MDSNEMILRQLKSLNRTMDEIGDSLDDISCSMKRIECNLSLMVSVELYKAGIACRGDLEQIFNQSSEMLARVMNQKPNSETVVKVP